MVAGVIGWGEGIVIEDGADIEGGLVWKRVRGKEAEGAGVVVEQFGDQGKGPGVVVGGRHGGEPHLPVEAEVVGGDLRRALIGAGGETFVGVFFPGSGIGGDIVISPFEHDIITLLADRSERAIGIDEVERIEGGVHDLVG